MKRLFFYATILFFVAPAHAQDLPQPSLALGFETTASLQTLTGKPGVLVSGKHGQAVTGLRGWFAPGTEKLVNAQTGTVTAWVKLLQKPAGGFSLRWLKFSTELGIYWGSDKPMLLGVKTSEKNEVLIEREDWHHWAYVWDGDKRRLFIDGELVLEGEQKAHDAPFGFIFIAEENELKWAIDDFRVYREALSAPQIAADKTMKVVRDAAGDLLPPPSGPVQQPAQDTAPDDAVVYGERQLVLNPSLNQILHTRSPDEVPRHWRIGEGSGAVTPGVNRLHIESAAAPVAVQAELARSRVRPGGGYRVGLRYTLKSNGAKVLLRFRNQIDRGTREVSLPDTTELQRKFFWMTAPEDYDVGLYFLEVRIEGAGAVMDIEGAYCRAATDEEIVTNKMEVEPIAFETRPTVKPDESWIAALSGEKPLISSPLLRQAWQTKSDAALSYKLKADGSSLLLEHSPQELWKALKAAREKNPQMPLQIAASRPGQKVPGGNGLDPLPPRSVSGAALLFGVGAQDNGIGSFQHQHVANILRENGMLDEAAQFLPFWTQSAIYPARAVEKAPDWNEKFAGKKDAPLFGHSAPGVLVSGYRNGSKLLLVLANTTNQERGKLGDLWIDLARVFDIKTLAGTPLNDGRIVIRDAETGHTATTNWNRKGGGYPANYVFNVGIEPGDYRLILVESKL